MAKVVVFEDSPTHLLQIGVELGKHGHGLVASANTLPHAYRLLNRMIDPKGEDRERFADLTAVVLAGSVSHDVPRAQRPNFRGPALNAPEPATGMFARFRKPPSAPPHVIPYAGHFSDAEMVVDVMNQYGLLQRETGDELPIIGVSRGPLTQIGVRPELDLGKVGIPRLGAVVTELYIQQQVAMQLRESQQ